MRWYDNSSAATTTEVLLMMIAVLLWWRSSQRHRTASHPRGAGDLLQISCLLLGRQTQGLPPILHGVRRRTAGHTQSSKRPWVCATSSEVSTTRLFCFRRACTPDHSSSRDLCYYVMQLLPVGACSVRCMTSKCRSQGLGLRKAAVLSRCLRMVGAAPPILALQDPVHPRPAIDQFTHPIITRLESTPRSRLIRDSPRSMWVICMR